MKFLKRIGLILAILALVLGTMTYNEYKQMKSLEPSFQVFTFNDQSVEYKTATVRYQFLNGLIPFYQEYKQDKVIRFTTDQILNTLLINPNTNVKVTTPDQKTLTFIGTQTTALEEDGDYKFELDESREDGSKFHYEFFVTAKNLPKITISNLSPFQGEILMIDISNIKQNSLIEIEKQFIPSAVLQDSHKARFYLPIQFKADAKIYPLTLVINDKSYTYDLDVQAANFKKDYFSIDTELIKSTSGNPIATNEFNATIRPLYETAELFEYWKGNFILPVKNARISASFGDMRYINNAKTPSRHGGIDYAIACGTDVTASNAGKVDFAGFLILTGNTVVIDHGLGLKTYYQHMQNVTVKTGDLVDKGQLIGHVGTTGISTGCHLHFQAMVKTQAFNPNFLYQID